MSDIQCRELCEDDARSMRELRLSVLETDPTTFSITFDEEQEQSIDLLEKMLSGSKKSSSRAMFGAFQGGLVGVIGVERVQGQMLEHKARISGLYVLRPYRRIGVGRCLLKKAVAFAKSLDGVTKILLEVSGDAQNAIRLYEKAGFKRFATEEDACKYDDRLIDEHRMELSI